MEGEKHKRARGLWKECDYDGRSWSMLDEGRAEERAEGRDWLLERGGNQGSGGLCCCWCSVPKSCPTLCDPIYCSMPGSSVLHYLPSLLKFTSTELVMLPNHLILCHPLLLLLSIFPKVFFNQLVLHIRWPKYWSFSFSISLSNEYSELISFKTDWFNWSPCSPRDSQVFSSTKVWRHQFFGSQPFLLSSSHIHTWLLEKS